MAITKWKCFCALLLFIIATGIVTLFVTDNSSYLVDSDCGVVSYSVHCSKGELPSDNGVSAMQKVEKILNQTVNYTRVSSTLEQQDGMLEVSDTSLKLTHVPRYLSSGSKLPEGRDMYRKWMDTHEYDFTLPHPYVFRPLREVVHTAWFESLLEYLGAINLKQISLVIANLQYQDVLLNWLISAKVVAKPPMKNVLVIAIDEELQKVMQTRDISSLHIPRSSFLNLEHRFKGQLEPIMTIRLGLMRIINHLGFDVALYDTDAIILRNPQPLYDARRFSDIVGSRGGFPQPLVNKWQVTICMGAIFIRSNSRTEQYWEAVAHDESDTVNDQIRFNYGLDTLGVQWRESPQVYARDTLNTEAFGTCSNGLNITVLPHNVICRNVRCESQKRGLYYIWHKGGDRTTGSKMSGAQQGHTWFLREDWKIISDRSELKGLQWLQNISHQLTL